MPASDVGYWIFGSISAVVGLTVLNGFLEKRSKEGRAKARKEADLSNTVESMLKSVGEANRYLQSPKQMRAWMRKIQAIIIRIGNKIGEDYSLAFDLDEKPDDPPPSSPKTEPKDDP